MSQGLDLFEAVAVGTGFFFTFFRCIEFVSVNSQSGICKRKINKMIM